MLSIDLDVGRNVGIAPGVEKLDGDRRCYGVKDVPRPVGKGVGIVFGGIPSNRRIGCNEVDKDQDKEQDR